MTRATKLLGSWADVLGPELDKPYMKQISKLIMHQNQTIGVQPPPQHIFRAFRETDYNNLKVVIIGQDPYPTAGNADGLAFSFSEGTLHEQRPMPRSLQNIFKEVENSYGMQVEHNPDLGRWARQGVLLLNTCLTTVTGYTNAHEGIGWHHFTHAVMQAIAKRPNMVVFMLWGNYARQYKSHVADHHEYLETTHPSPFSAHRGFLGSGHFKNCNEILALSKQTPIDWLNNSL